MYRRKGKNMRFYEILLISGILGLSIPAFAQAMEPLKGEVEKEWTIDDVRREAFKNVILWRDLGKYPSIDPNLIENKIIVEQGGGSTSKRVITVFSGGLYLVSERISSDTIVAFSYSNQGELYHILYLESPGIPPGIHYKYSAIDVPSENIKKGQLIEVSIATDANNSFIFETNGLLKAHWVGDNCYRADGSSCGSRSTFETAQ